MEGQRLRDVGRNRGAETEGCGEKQSVWVCVFVHVCLCVCMHTERRGVGGGQRKGGISKENILNDVGPRNRDWTKLMGISLIRYVLSGRDWGMWGETEGQRLRDVGRNRGAETEGCGEKQRGRDWGMGEKQRLRDVGRNRGVETEGCGEKQRGRETEG